MKNVLNAGGLRVCLLIHHTKLYANTSFFSSWFELIAALRWHSNQSIAYRCIQFNNIMCLYVEIILFSLFPTQYTQIFTIKPFYFHHKIYICICMNVWFDLDRMQTHTLYSYNGRHSRVCQCLITRADRHINYSSLYYYYYHDVRFERIFLFVTYFIDVCMLTFVRHTHIWVHGPIQLLLLLLYIYIAVSFASFICSTPLKCNDLEEFLNMLP